MRGVDEGECPGLAAEQEPLLAVSDGSREPVGVQTGSAGALSLEVLAFLR